MNDDQLNVLVFAFAIFVVIPVLFGIVYMEAEKPVIPDFSNDEVRDSPLHFSIEKTDNSTVKISHSEATKRERLDITIHDSNDNLPERHFITRDEVLTINLTNSAKTEVIVSSSHVWDSTKRSYTFYSKPINERINFSEKPFVMTVDTRIDAGRHTDNTEFKIKTGNDKYTYDYSVHWEDSSKHGLNSDYTVDFDSPGVYQIAITGKMPHLQYESGIFQKDSGVKIVEINQWGDIQWKSFERSFRNTPNLKGDYTDKPNLTQVQSTEQMFEGATKFNGSVSGWDMSSVTTTRGMFAYARSFNRDISSWNTSNVRNMNSMFYKANSYNNGGKQLNLNTSSVTNFKNMFYGARDFNQNISSWNTSNAKTMEGMFLMSESFNQNISTWDTSNVRNMDYMLFDTRSFNQNISTWNVESVIGKPEKFTKYSRIETNSTKKPNF